MDEEEDKKAIIQSLNTKIGSDINEISHLFHIETDLLRRRGRFQNCLREANSEAPTKLSSAIKKAERNSKQIEELKSRRENLKVKVDNFLNRVKPLRTELDKRFGPIQKLEATLAYLQSFEKIDNLSRQLKQCSDDEQAVLLYGDLKEMCMLYQKGHRGAHVKECTHYWHNVLKDRLTKHYEELMNQLKWPSQALEEISPTPKEVLVKFGHITKYLFLIQEPEDLLSSNITEDFSKGQDPCLPVKILLRPLKKRFIFHFTGPRQTARIDRPEWFLSQTLKWVKMHHSFVRNHIQPVADKLQIKNVKAVDEFIAGVVALAAERLHTVLGLYNTQGLKGELVDMDAAFAHAVDETLGFHKELSALTGRDANGVLSVLTRAEIFVRWLAVEKKYALSKMDETLSSEQWSEPVGAGVSAAVGAVVWVPRAADWFVALLRTINERYSVLPQPGHRLQFLELQLELIEEWRVRLTQLMNAALAVMLADSFLSADAPRHLIAVINGAHHTRTVLLQWAHALHYLQLHFYRKQFQHFTHLQHHDDNDSSVSYGSESEDHERKSSKAEGESEEVKSLDEVEQRAKKLALDEVLRRDSNKSEQMFDVLSPQDLKLAMRDAFAAHGDAEEGGVFGEAPALLTHLRDAGLTALSDRILLEFKASMREYKTQNWHAMPIMEQMALSVSPTLCRPLSELCMRMSRAADSLAPALARRLRAHLAAALDQYIFEEVALSRWFNTGGTVQFTHDVKRNLVPTFAPAHKNASQINQLPKLEDACKILNLDYTDARRLRVLLINQPDTSDEHMTEYGIRHITPEQTLRILNQRTDLTDPASTSTIY